MELVLENVSKIVNGENHICNVTLKIESGATNVILGHTLAGKTSLLRLMAGLDRPSKGRIILDGRDVTGLFVRKRSVAMVYQQFVNYPSMTVYKNIASPLKLSGMSRADIDQQVRKAAAMLHIEDLLDRLPAELSGGQQQRTAIARSLVKDSELLLLDEPLVNLDYKLREELQVELQEIFKERKAIVVYTTTEPAEALMLGGNIVVMDEGKVLQTGSTPYVYHHPVTTRVAEVFSDPPINFLPGVVSGNKALLGEDIEIPMEGHLKSIADGKYIFSIHANHLSLSNGGVNKTEIRARVELAEINGSETFVHINHGDTHLVVQEDGVHSRHIGSELSVFTNPDCFFVFSEAGQLLAAPFSNG